MKTTIIIILFFNRNISISILIIKNKTNLPLLSVFFCSWWFVTNLSTLFIIIYYNNSTTKSAFLKPKVFWQCLITCFNAVCIITLNNNIIIKIINNNNKNILSLFFCDDGYTIVVRQCPSQKQTSWNQQKPFNLCVSTCRVREFFTIIL